tara:strand:+ start:572 stop:919 length:348 start_codon:yes stop_codon:yes gene_type:complete
MGQRISIQYSIDIDDLEYEVERLLQNAQEEIKLMRDVNITSRLSLGTVEDIDEVRQKLAAIDASLEDVSSIITGYVGYKASKNMPAEQPEVEADDNTTQQVEQTYEKPPEIEYSF